MSISPSKYYTGLTKQEVMRRKKEIDKRKVMSHKNPKAYKPFKTDTNKKTKRSKYTTEYIKLYGINNDGLNGITKTTGIPLDILKRIYNKGLAAWRTGHRPGATQSQWGYARVYSFVMKGCTYYYPDHKEVEEAKSRSIKSVRHWDKIKKFCNK